MSVAPYVSSPKEAVRKMLDMAQLRRGEVLYDLDLSEADVVTLYLSLSGNETLKPKLERELKTNARVVSLDIQIKGWTPIHTSEAPGKHIIYLYQVGSN